MYHPAYDTGNPNTLTRTHIEHGLQFIPLVDHGRQFGTPRLTGNRLGTPVFLLLILEELVEEHIRWQFFETGYDFVWVGVRVLEGQQGCLGVLETETRIVMRYLPMAKSNNVYKIW